MSCLTAWYTRKELAFRTALLYCGSLVSGAFSGLIAAGITADLDGALGISAWRWLFIIEVGKHLMLRPVTTNRDRYRAQLPSSLP